MLVRSCAISPFVHCVDSITSIIIIIKIIIRIVNLSVSSCVFLKHFKSAFVKTLLKKPNLDSNNLKTIVQYQIYPFYLSLQNLLLLTVSHYISIVMVLRLICNQLVKNFIRQKQHSFNVQNYILA